MKLMAPFEAYRGSEPYLFASYAHRDATKVFPVLDFLRKKGWRIWYDEGIEPGNEWPDEIAKALNRCSQFLNFMSPSAAESKNVRDEIYNAIDRKTPMLIVHLESFEILKISEGLDMRLKSLQSVRLFDYVDIEDCHQRKLQNAFVPACRAKPQSIVEHPVLLSATTRDKACPHCHKPIQAEWMACPYCEVALAFNCPNPSCGKRVGATFKKCPLCATTLLCAKCYSRLDGNGKCSKCDEPVARTKLQPPQVSRTHDKSSDVGETASLDGFVFVQGGTFTMGNLVSESGPDNKKQYQVKLRSFQIAVTEVTQSLWTRVMGSNPSQFKGDQQPVETISWYDAVAFCNKLSQIEGLNTAYLVNGKSVKWLQGTNGYRMPTEAEWEFAARGGLQSRGTIYAGSNTVAEVAWDASTSGRTTHPVGQKRPNELGLYDMSGNVREWCWDRDGEYPTGKQTDPSGPSSGSRRVLRGGSWHHDELSVRSVSRFCDDPGGRCEYFGLRLVLPVQKGK